MRVKITFLALVFAALASGCQQSPKADVELVSSPADSSNENPYIQDPFNDPFTADAPATDPATVGDSVGIDPDGSGDGNLPFGLPAPDFSGATPTEPVATTPTIPLEDQTCAQQGKLSEPFRSDSCFGVRAPDEYQSLSLAVELFSQRGVNDIQSMFNSISGNPQFVEVGLTAADTPSSLTQLRSVGENKLFMSIKTDTGYEYLFEQ